MLTVFMRTVLIYIFLLVIMRILGKRQIGELEASELVTTLLLSDIATLPITDSNIPFTFAVIPMITIMSIEIFTSFIIIKIPKLRRVISSPPSVIISKGVLNQAELKKQRISIEELLCEVRAAGYATLDEVYYAIVEDNGSLSVIPKVAYRQVTLNDIGISQKESGMMHIIISDGRVDKNGLKTISKDSIWLDSYLKRKKITAKDIFLMLSDDNEKITLIKKEGFNKK